MAGAVTPRQSGPKYRGLRMNAEQYLALPDDGYRYELIDGVITMSPSPSFKHQDLSSEIVTQLRTFLRNNPIGKAVAEVDVRLSDGLVYRPDLIFLDSEKAARCGTRVTEIPDLVVEVVSADSRSYDSVTKKGDYEAAGIAEYWLIDPGMRKFTFYRLVDGRYVEQQADADRFKSSVVKDFELDLAGLRKIIE